MKLVKYFIAAMLVNFAIGACQAVTLEWNTFDGDFLSLDDYQGKVVLVTYWAIYCPPCHRNMKNLEKVYPKFKKQGLEIIAISLDSSEDAVRKHMQQHGITFPVTMKSYTSGSKNLLNVKGTPTNFLIDRNGNIVKIQYGAMSVDTIEQWVKNTI